MVGIPEFTDTKHLHVALEYLAIPKLQWKVMIEDPVLTSVRALEYLVVAHGQLDVARDDAGLLLSRAAFAAQHRPSTSPTLRKKCRIQGGGKYYGYLME